MVYGIFFSQKTVESYFTFNRMNLVSVTGKRNIKWGKVMNRRGKYQISIARNKNYEQMFSGNNQIFFS